MPDKRRHRGAHPEDERLFGASQRQTLYQGVTDYSWLLSRGYAQDSALKLVGDRHHLTARQRTAVWRSSCSDQSLKNRTGRLQPLADCGGQRVGIDGYNLLITIESALSGGVILIGRDGAYRDLASIHGTYRKVEETATAVALIIDFLGTTDAGSIDFYLDRPVSNSGRLKALMAEVLEGRQAAWNIELVRNPDSILAGFDGVVVTTDSWILDRCRRWANLARELITDRLPDTWCLDLCRP